MGIWMVIIAVGVILLALTMKHVVAHFVEESFLVFVGIFCIVYAAAAGTMVYLNHADAANQQGIFTSAAVNEETTLGTP